MYYTEKADNDCDTIQLISDIREFIFVISLTLRLNFSRTKFIPETKSTTLLVISLEEVKLNS